LDNLRESLKVKKERAILVGAKFPGQVGDDLSELTSLAQSAGAIVVDRLQQKMKYPHPGLYIGKGKAGHLAERVEQYDADVVIFDNDLAPNQIRELEKIVKVKVLDRSELILDIFATRAQTRQAKLQVSLAQLEYTYPRLTRMWSHLDSVVGAGGGTSAGAVGGIGTRGTGEQQLEIDRRLVQKKITELKRQLKNIDKRKLREIKGRANVFKTCMVGYTNAGKSTLLNRLTDSCVLVEDRLFATLDTRTKKWIPEKGTTVLLSDTVGFVRHLPHQLVASFKATLEEAVNADLLINVIDVSNPDALKQIESVDSVLAEIGCQNKQTLKVFNKADSLSSLNQLEMLQTLFSDALTISAKTGLGLDKLSTKVAGICKGSEITVSVTAAASNGKTYSFLRGNASILQENYTDSTVNIVALIGRNQLPALERTKPQNIEIID